MKHKDKLQDDLYHVITPVVLATLIAPSSLGGAALFLIVWAAVRYVSG